MSEPASVLDLPASFIQRNADPEWLGALPDRLARLAETWALRLDPPFPGIGFNYVAPAIRADGTSCVLKVSRHIGDTRAEIEALRIWDGQGAARLLEAAPEDGAALLERVRPGTMLDEVAESDDDASTRIAAEMLSQLWRPSQGASHLIPLDAWCAAFDRNRDVLSRGAGGFPADLFREADALRRDLLASTVEPTLLHGDLHHFNILKAGRAPWLAIDPKGLVGDRSFDLCQFLRNPRRVPPEVNQRRLDLFCAELGLDRERARAWCFVHAMLDACWSFEDGEPWERAIAYVKETRQF